MTSLPRCRSGISRSGNTRISWQCRTRQQETTYRTPSSSTRHQERRGVRSAAILLFTPLTTLPIDSTNSSATLSYLKVVSFPTSSLSSCHPRLRACPFSSLLLFLILSTGKEKETKSNLVCILLYIMVFMCSTMCQYLVYIFTTIHSISLFCIRMKRRKPVLISPDKCFIGTEHTVHCCAALDKTGLTT